ncbi:hypothetical protein H5T89_02025 [bacterium]|nr:hypothetical protein [bacterium]
MYNRVTFLIIIALVCISVLGTVILVGRFTREEYQPATIPPPLPEIPKEEVKEVAFQYAPDVYRDPFKKPITVKIATEKTEEAILAKPAQPTPVTTLKLEPVRVPPVKETKPQETRVIEEKRPEREVKVNKKVASEPKQVESKGEAPPLVKITGIIYDNAPFAIIEFEGKSGIFEEGDKLSQDLIVKKIYLDSVDLKWKDRVYNIKLGGN